jgi:4-amino-4-deoxy-L-arabinose transferase-like glycosyltransferase
MENRSDSSRFWLVLVGALCILIFVIRITGPTDLEGWAQHRNVGYVMDMMWQGNWIVQHDIQGRILSKPPLHTWLISPFAAVFGVDRLAMTIPSFLAVFALSLLVFFEGRRRFGVMAGGLAALSVVLAPMVSKHIALVRSDPVFALAIAVGAFAAIRAWETGRGWMLFWVAGAVATLTKGPLGIILAAAGLLAYFWEKRTDPVVSPPRGSQLPGIVIFLLVTLSWFLLAVREQGFDVIDKMFFDELVGQAVGARKDSFPGENLPKPTLFLLLRFLPFSVFFFYGLWRVFREPAADPHERRFERFLAAWVLTGLVIFSLAAHHRADLLLPLWPACALLAGRELVHFSERVGLARFSAGLTTVCVILVAVIFANYHVTFGKRAENTDHAAQVRLAADAIVAQGIDPRQLQHSGTSVTLQMYLGTFHPWLSSQDLRELLASGQTPILLAVESRGMDAIESLPRAVSAELIFEWIESDSGEPLIRIYKLVP